MTPSALEIRRLKVQRTQLRQIFCTKPSKLIEQLRQRLALAFPELGEAVEWHECLCVAELEDHSQARHPIRTLAVDQMAHDVERRPCVLALVVRGPRLRQVAQQHIERRRRTRQQRDGVDQVLFHEHLVEVRIQSSANCVGRTSGSAQSPEPLEGTGGYMTTAGRACTVSPEIESNTHAWGERVERRPLTVTRVVLCQCQRHERRTRARTTNPVT